MSNRVNLSPPPTHVDVTDGIWKKWFNQLFNRVGEAPFKIRGYTRTSVPDATQYGDISSAATAYTSLIFVYDTTGTPAPALCYSNGSVWLRVDTNAAI